jgi:hypothetical protein
MTCLPIFAYEFMFLIWAKSSDYSGGFKKMGRAENRNPGWNPGVIQIA